MTHLIKSTYTHPGENNRPLIIDVSYTSTMDKLPVILFCHGFKGFKDWGAWNLMATVLAGSGFLVVKFNYSHNGGTALRPIDFPDLDAFSNNNYSYEVRDTLRMLDWIENCDIPADLNQIYLMGHSRAGGITTIVSAMDKRVKKLTTLAGVANYADRFPKGNAFIEWQDKGVIYLENGRTKQQMPLKFQIYTDFITNRNTLNIQKCASNLTIPHLIVHGDADPTVHVQDAYLLKRANPNAQLIIVKGANHVFGAQHPWKKSHLPDDLQKTLQCCVNFLKSAL